MSACSIQHLIHDVLLNSPMRAIYMLFDIVSNNLRTNLAKTQKQLRNTLTYTNEVWYNHPLNDVLQFDTA